MDMPDCDPTKRGENLVPGDPNAGPMQEPVMPDTTERLDSRGGGDELLGIPDDAPDWTRPVSDEENLFAQGDESEEDFDQALLEATDGGGLAGALRGWLGLKPVIVLLVCAVLLFVMSQLFSLHGQLRGLPPVMRIGSYVLVGLLVGGTAWAMWRLVRVFAHKRTSPRLPVEALRELSERAGLRIQANARLKYAEDALRRFVAEYPLDDDSETGKLLRKCLKEGELRSLRESRGVLLEQDSCTPEGWLADFDRGFLSVLDSAARKRIRHYGWYVAGKTMALPSSLDPAAILLNTYLMARDLCLVYNLRTSRSGTGAILIRVLCNAVLASGAGEWADSAAQVLFTGTQIAADIVRKVTARLAEGAANKLFFHRLGAAMVRHLRPIWPPMK